MTTIRLYRTENFHGVDYAQEQRQPVFESHVFPATTENIYERQRDGKIVDITDLCKDLPKDEIGHFMGLTERARELALRNDLPAASFVQTLIEPERLIAVLFGTDPDSRITSRQRSIGAGEVKSIQIISEKEFSNAVQRFYHETSRLGFECVRTETRLFSAYLLETFWSHPDRQYLPKIS